MYTLLILRPVLLRSQKFRRSADREFKVPITNTSAIISAFFMVPNLPPLNAESRGKLTGFGMESRLERFAAPGNRLRSGAKDSTKTARSLEPLFGLM